MGKNLLLFCPVSLSAPGRPSACCLRAEYTEDSVVEEDARLAMGAARGSGEVGLEQRRRLERGHAKCPPSGEEFDLCSVASGTELVDMDSS